MNQGGLIKACGPELAGTVLVLLSSGEGLLSVPDGCLFLSIANLCKKQLTVKISLVAPRQTPNLYFVLLTGENVFSLLAVTCKFSLRPCADSGE